MENILPYVQIILSVVLVVMILLQHSDASSGGAFGQSDNFSGAVHTRRGAERFVFIATVVTAVLLVASAFLALIITK